MLTVNFNEIDIYEVLRNNYDDPRIRKIYSSLTEEEQTVLDYRIGLDEKTLTRRAIAEKMGITIDRVRGIEERTLKRLKHPARIQYLNEVIDPNFKASERANEFFDNYNKKM